MRKALSFALLVLLLSFPASCRRAATQKENEQLQTLRDNNKLLHDRLELLIDRDTYLASALADSAEVVLALPDHVIHDLFHEIARTYFDQVEINLTPDDLQVDEEGELKVKTFLGKMAAGDWKVHLDIHQLRGTLSAGVPEVRVTGTNRLHMSVPAYLKQGAGSATLAFAWDPKGLGNLVCNKYETTQAISGRVIPKKYQLQGDFILTAGEEDLMADPEFPPDKFVISIDPSAETWDKVRAELKSQDKIFKCGLVLNPDGIIDKLKGLGERGFKAKLPRKLFRPVSLPASITKSVRVGSSVVQLDVRPNVLRVTPTTFWYSASVKARATPSPAESTPGSQDSSIASAPRVAVRSDPGGP